METPDPSFLHYRQATIGKCLIEALDELVQNSTLLPEHALTALMQFDKTIAEVLKNKITSKVSIKGHLHTYNFFENVWTFTLEDAVFKTEDGLESVNKVKIVAHDSKP